MDFNWLSYEVLSLGDVFDKIVLHLQSEQSVPPYKDANKEGFDTQSTVSVLRRK